jgi:signal transduction histidine kinase
MAPRARTRNFPSGNLSNLSGNVVRYRTPGRYPEIRISAERQGSNWLISVADNGIGIDPQYTGQIFQIFKRLHGQRYPGAGIGLALCQRIVERYGGRIWADSELGVGSTFRVLLPADTNS